MTKAQKTRAADYRALGLGYEIVGMREGNLVISRPLRNGRPGTCFQLIAPEGKTIQTFVRYET